MGMCGRTIGVGLLGGFFFPLLFMVVVIGGIAYMVLNKKKET